MLLKVHLWLDKIIYILFAIIVLLLIILNIKNSTGFESIAMESPNYFNSLTAIISILLIGFLFLFRKSILQLLQIINPKKVVFPLLLISIILQILVVHYLNIKPSWDFGILVDESKHLLQTGKLVSYFESYSNNVFAVVLLAFLGKIFSPDLQVYQTINITIITISQYLIYRLGTKVTCKEVGLFGFIISVFFFPYLFYSPIVYTDTMSLLFLLIPLNILTSKQNSFKLYVFYLIVSSVILSFGVLLKGSLIVFIIALCITLFLDMKKRKKLLFIVPILLLLVVKILFNHWIFDNKILDKNKVDKYSFPVTHWFFMGQNDETQGRYSDADFRYTFNNIYIIPREELIRYHMTEWQNRIKSRGLSGNVHFFSEKLTNTWADGTYFSLNKLSRFPIIPSNFQELTDGTSGILVQGFARVQHLLLLAGLLFFALLNWKKENRNHVFFTFAMLSLIGFFFFFLLWETRSRYIVSLTPLLIIVSATGYLQVVMKWNKNIKKD